MKKTKKTEAERLYEAELARITWAEEESYNEMEARGWKPYENIELPEELRNDPNYLPF